MVKRTAYNTITRTKNCTSFLGMRCEIIKATHTQKTTEFLKQHQVGNTRPQQTEIYLSQISTHLNATNNKINSAEAMNKQSQSTIT